MLGFGYCLMFSWVFCFLRFTSSVSLTSFDTEDEPLKVVIRETFLIEFCRHSTNVIFVWERAGICRGQSAANGQGTRSAKKDFDGPWQGTRKHVGTVARRSRIHAIHLPRQ